MAKIVMQSLYCVLLPTVSISNALEDVIRHNSYIMYYDLINFTVEALHECLIQSKQHILFTH